MSSASSTNYRADRERLATADALELRLMGSLMSPRRVVELVTTALF